MPILTDTAGQGGKMKDSGNRFRMYMLVLMSYLPTNNDVKNYFPGRHNSCAKPERKNTDYYTIL